MKYLLDTHTFLWCLFNGNKLSAVARRAILDSESVVFVSTISLWEISLKFSLGKLELKNVRPENLLPLAEDAGFEIAIVSPETFAEFYRLPRKYGDPFDRMLVWQALRDDLSLITKDKVLKDSYRESGLKCLW